MKAGGVVYVKIVMACFRLITFKLLTTKIESFTDRKDEKYQSAT
ncbi:hypothetical protein DOY81_004741, partial [Sarcophaga bullata]